MDVEYALGGEYVFYVVAAEAGCASIDGAMGAEFAFEAHLGCALQYHIDHSAADGISKYIVVQVQLLYDDCTSSPFAQSDYIVVGVLADISAEHLVGSSVDRPSAIETIAGWLL